MKKLTRKTIFYTTLGLVGLVAVSSLAWGIYTIVNNSNSNNNVNQYRTGDNSEKSFVNLNVDSSESEDLNLEVVENGYIDLLGEEKYFLGEAGREILINRIKNDLGYGPEIFILKRIWITNNESVIDEDTNGYYTPSTYEIVLNTTNYLDSFEFSSGNETDVMNAKVEIIFQTLYHEYFHHIANIYINSIPTSSQYASNEIYEDTFLISDDQTSPARSLGNWNDKFVDQFKNLLNYDEDSPKYELPLGSDRFKSIGEIYDAQDLFDFANSSLEIDAKTYSDLDGNNYKFQGRWRHDPRFSADSNVGGLTYTSEDYSILSYLFSLDELFARKYMQLTYPYNPLISEYLDSDGWFENSSSEWSPTTFARDLQRYQGYMTEVRSGVSIYTTYNSEDLANQRFLHDAPFNQLTYWEGGNENASYDLHQLLSDLMGQNSGSDISLIWSFNSAEIVDSNNRSIASAGDTRLIKFGGYLSSDQNYTHVGYYNSNNEFVSVPISIHDYTFKYKEELSSSTKIDLVEDGENFFYVLDEYITWSQWINSTLYFANNEFGVDAVPLVSVDSDINGVASSFYSSFPDEATRSNQSVIEAVSDESGVKIEVSEWTW